MFNNCQTNKIMQKQILPYNRKHYWEAKPPETKTSPAVRLMLKRVLVLYHSLSLLERHHNQSVLVLWSLIRKLFSTRLCYHNSVRYAGIRNAKSLLTTLDNLKHVIICQLTSLPLPN